MIYSHMSGPITSGRRKLGDVMIYVMNIIIEVYLVPSEYHGFFGEGYFEGVGSFRVTAVTKNCGISQSPSW